MATSTLGYYARFSEAAINGLDFVDSGMAQRALGNLNHLADQYAQVRCEWVAPTGNAGIVADGDTLALGAYQRLWTTPPFDLHVRGEFSTYRLRVSLRVHSGDATDAATFRVVLAPVGEGADELFSGDDNVAEETVAGASFAWVRHADLLFLDAARVRRATRSVAAINEVGGATATAKWLRVEASVWVSPDDDIASVPALGGVELEEYYGP